MKNLLIVISVSLCMAAGGAYAQNKVYKSKDADGNIIYTDQAPPEGAEAMVLPGLSIVTPRENQESVRTLNVNRRPESGVTATALPSMEELRQTYSAVEISSPKDDEQLWGTGNTVDVTINLKGPLLAGLSIQLTLDGQALPRQSSTSIRLDELYRGAHTLQAAVVDGNGQVFGRSDTVNFFVRQHSVNFNRPAPGGN